MCQSEARESATEWSFRIQAGTFRERPRANSLDSTGRGLCRDFRARAVEHVSTERCSGAGTGPPAPNSIELAGQRRRVALQVGAQER